MSEEKNKQTILDWMFQIRTRWLVMIGILLIPLGYVTIVEARIIYYFRSYNNHKAKMKSRGLPTTYKEWDEYQRNKVNELGYDVEDCSVDNFRDIIPRDKFGNHIKASKLSGGLKPTIRELDKYQILYESITDNQHQNSGFTFTDNSFMSVISEYFSTSLVHITTKTIAEKSQPSVIAVLTLLKTSHLMQNYPNSRSCRDKCDNQAIMILETLLGTHSLAPEVLANIKVALQKQISSYADALKLEYLLTQIMIHDALASAKVELSSIRVDFLLRDLKIRKDVHLLLSDCLEMLELIDELSKNLPESSLVDYNFSTLNKIASLGGYELDHIIEHSRKHLTKEYIHSHYTLILKLILASLAIDIELFRHEHGRVPKDIAELEAHLGKPLPQDPFFKAKVRYDVTQSGYMLKSVGPDGTAGTDDDVEFWVNFAEPEEDNGTKE